MCGCNLCITRSHRRARPAVISGRLTKPRFFTDCRAFHLIPPFLGNFLIQLSAPGDADHLPGWATIHLRASAGCVQLVKCAFAEHARSRAASGDSSWLCTGHDAQLGSSSSSSSPEGESSARFGAVAAACSWRSSGDTPPLLPICALKLASRERGGSCAHKQHRCLPKRWTASTLTRASSSVQPAHLHLPSGSNHRLLRAARLLGFTDKKEKEEEKRESEPEPESWIRG